MSRFLLCGGGLQLCADGRVQLCGEPECPCPVAGTQIRRVCTGENQWTETEVECEGCPNPEAMRLNFAVNQDDYERTGGPGEPCGENIYTTNLSVTAELMPNPSCAPISGSTLNPACEASGVQEVGPPIWAGRSVRSSRQMACHRVVESFERVAWLGVTPFPGAPICLERFITRRERVVINIGCPVAEGDGCGGPASAIFRADLCGGDGHIAYSLAALFAGGAVGNLEGVLLRRAGLLYEPTLIGVDEPPVEVEVVHGQCEPVARLIRCGLSPGAADLPGTMLVRRSVLPGEAVEGESVYRLVVPGGLGPVEWCYRFAATMPMQTYWRNEDVEVVDGPFESCAVCEGGAATGPVKIYRRCGGSAEVRVREDLVVDAPVVEIDGVCHELVGEEVAVPDVSSASRIGPIYQTCDECAAPLVRHVQCGGSNVLYSRQDEWDQALAEIGAGDGGRRLVRTGGSPIVCFRLAVERDVTGVDQTPVGMETNRWLLGLPFAPGNSVALCGTCSSLPIDPGPVDPQVRAPDPGAEAVIRRQTGGCVGCGEGWSG